MNRKNLKSGSPGNKRPPVNQVPEGMEGIELDARRKERLQAAQALKSARTPLTVIEVANQATVLAEQTIAELKKMYRPPALACREGCDWCCYLTVGTAAPEVVRIVDHLRRTLSPDQLDALRERVIRQDDQRRELKAARRGPVRLPCVFLEDHRCSIYPVRPLTCRGCNSTSARQCELFVDPRNKAVVPMYVPQHRLTTFVLDGMRAGIGEAGLRGELLELTGALRIALENPEAIGRWLAGESVFESARND